ncbi:MAG: nucleoside deaminase [Desulfuromonadaceae bacterium]|nr:nucleoside deaminase [Desulfuromonadaceae bacterium]
MQPPLLEIRLPLWLQQQIAGQQRILATPDQRMRWVIDLGWQSIRQPPAERGGPFAAAVFDADNHELVAAGVNLVLPAGASIAHAEIVALTQAQKTLGYHRLDLIPNRRFELVSSTEPCAMCLGALPWAGIHRLLCGATERDARAIGFDEGDKPQNWPKKLRARGIEVETGLCRDEAADLLQGYLNEQGTLY